jgi:metal-sulfur cluster biosynthetic enzyme
MQNNKIYWDALKDVKDPEFPISVVDMGLIQGIEQQGEGHVVVTMTYTSTACPCMQWIEEDIKNRLLKEDRVNEVEIYVTWNQPWTADDLSDDGRKALQEWGVTAFERAR